MAARWRRDPTPVTVKVAERLSDKIIINESYSQAYSDKKVESLIIYDQEYSISGKLCVKNDGSVYVKNPGDLEDASCKYIDIASYGNYICMYLFIFGSRGVTIIICLRHWKIKSAVTMLCGRLCPARCVLTRWYAVLSI